MQILGNADLYGQLRSKLPHWGAVVILARRVRTGYTNAIALQYLMLAAVHLSRLSCISCAMPCHPLYCRGPSPTHLPIPHSPICSRVNAISCFILHGLISRRRTARFVPEQLGHLPLCRCLEFGRIIHDCIMGRVKRGSPKQGLSHAI